MELNGLQKERLDLLRRVNTLKVGLAGLAACQALQCMGSSACSIAWLTGRQPRHSIHLTTLQANRAPRTDVEARLANAVAEATNAAAAAADAAARAATACIIQRP